MKKVIAPDAAAGACRLTRAGLAVAAGIMLLGGCGTQGIDTAYQLMEQQKAEQALIRQHELEQERKQAPTQPGLMLSVIRESQAQGRYFASLAYIDAYVRQFGAHPEVDVLRANALRMTGQAAQSESAYRTLLSGAHAAEGWHGLGLLAAARGDYAAAARDLAKAAERLPTDPDVQNDLGYARLRAGDLAGARLPLGKAAELAPDNARILANLALLLLVERDAAGAQRLMAQAGLTPEVRTQVYRLADEIARQAHTPSVVSTAPVHEQMAAAQAPVAPTVSGGSAAGQTAEGEHAAAGSPRPIVARVPQSPAASAPRTAAPVVDRTAANGPPVLPIQPMMERFAYPPVLR